MFAAPHSSNTVDTTPHIYTALTDRAVEQHQHHYDATTHGAQPIQHFESAFGYPYQRYNGYNPIVTGVNDKLDLSVAEHERVNAPSHTSTLSTATAAPYNSTFSNTASLSYGNTSSNGYESASSVQAQPEYEPYTHAQYDGQGEGYWRTQSIGYGMSYSGQDLAGVGAQFGGAK